MSQAARNALALATMVCATAWPSRVALAGDKASPPRCEVDAVLVGSASGTAPAFRVVVRDVLGQALPNQQVGLWFSTTSFVPFSSQNPGLTVNCAAGIVSGLTDAQGVAWLQPRFGGTDPAAAILVSANGIVLATVAGRSTDLDGSGGGTDLADFAAFAAAFTDGLAHPEMNFDRSHSNLPDLADLALLARELAGATTGTYCP